MVSSQTFSILIGAIPIFTVLGIFIIMALSNVKKYYDYKKENGYIVNEEYILEETTWLGKPLNKKIIKLCSYKDYVAHTSNRVDDFMHYLYYKDLKNNNYYCIDIYNIHDGTKKLTRINNIEKFILEGEKD